jgi:superfamily II DNA or RNA helicase
MFESKVIPDYSFQVDLQAKFLKHLSDGSGVVLAATPGAGKTNMAIEIIGSWLTSNPGGSVLVMTHGQTVLRQQFYDRLAASPRSYTYAALGDEDANLAQVHIALPHYFQKRKPGRYGLIVIDEAHHFFDAEMVQRVLRANKSAKVLLLTGSPSPFIKSGDYPLVPMTVSELLDRNILTDPYIELVQTRVPLQITDYNAEENVRSDFEFTAPGATL